MKRAIPAPVGEAADGHGEKARGRRGRAERTPIDSYEAQPSPRHQRDYEPIAHRCWRATASFHSLCHSLEFPFSLSYNMYGTSDPRVGWAYTMRLRSAARIPERMASPNRLITSSASLPSRWAPRMRSVSSSTRTLNPEYFSPTRREEYQLEVISFLTLNFRACLRASLSPSPTDARGGIANTTVGMPR